MGHLYLCLMPHLQIHTKGHARSSVPSRVLTLISSVKLRSEIIASPKSAAIVGIPSHQAMRGSSIGRSAATTSSRAQSHTHVIPRAAACGLSLSRAFPRSGRRHDAVSTSASSDSGVGPSGGNMDDAWWDDLKRGSIGPRGPAGDAGSRTSGAGERDYTGMAEYLLGSSGYRELETVDKEERQRQWDAMRASAWLRYQQGTMPTWFNPAWLMQVQCACMHGRVVARQCMPQQQYMDIKRHACNSALDQGMNSQQAHW